MAKTEAVVVVKLDCTALEADIRALGEALEALADRLADRRTTDRDDDREAV